MDHSDTMNGQRELLSTLPPELRVEIFSMVTYHSEGCGVICPISDIPGAVNYVFMDNERYRIKNGELFLGPAMPNQTAEQHKFDDYLEAGFIIAKEEHGEHFCTLDCLRQPALTRVNSLYRREALPTFYYQNKFHLEFGQFETMQWTCNAHREAIEMRYGSPPVLHERPLFYPSYGFDLPFRTEQVAFRGFERTLGRSPVDWWRAVGDSNLNMIKRMTLILPSMNPLIEAMGTCVEVEIDQRENRVSVAEEHYSTRGVPALPNDLDSTDQLFDLQADQEKFLISKRMLRKDKEWEHEHLSPLMDPRAAEISRGINVAFLERILASFEPILAYWLRDDEYLVGDSWNVFVLKRVLALDTV